MLKKLLALALAFYMAAGPAWTQIVPDGSTNTSFGNSENNTPVVNIATPNQRGLSHNRFSDYNVGQDNLILNNSKDFETYSKLGGFTGANPNLKNSAEARIILNEITSNRVSNLNGYTEIAGKQAELIIANPNGINIAGAGFINTPRVSLITGRPDIDGAGNLAGFKLDRKGAINVQGTLDAQSADLYMVGRSVKSSGDIFANIINTALGNDHFDYITKQASSVSAADAPEYALDASALGGMYAGIINIIGTEAGLGVRTKANLVADLGDITITGAGGVEFGNAQAVNNINVSAVGDIIAEASYAGNDINISGQNINYDDIKAANDINAEATGNIAGGAAHAGDDVNMTGGGDITFAELISNNNIAVNVAGTLQGTLAHAGNDINLTGEDMTFGELKAKNNINLNALGALQGTLLQAGYNINLYGGDITFGELISNNDITAFAAGSLQAALALTQNDINLSGVDIAFDSLESGNDINVNASGALNGISAAAMNDISMLGSDIAFGQLAANNKITLNAAGVLQGTLAQAQNDINLTGGAVIYQDIQSGHDINLYTAGDLYGTLAQAQNDINITADTITFGGLESNNNIMLAATGMLQGESVQAQNDINVSGVSISLEQLISNSDITLNALAALQLTMARAQNNITLAGHTVNYDMINANHDIIVNAFGALNGNVSYAQNDINLTGLNIDYGELKSNRDTNINAAGDLQGTLIQAQGNINLAGGDITFDTLESNNNITISASGALQGTAAYAQNDIGLTARSINYGLLKGNNITAKAIAGLLQGTLAQAQNDINMQGTAITFGEFESNHSITLNTAGALSDITAHAQNDITLVGGDISYNELKAAGNISVNAMGLLQGALAHAQNDITVRAANINYDTLKAGRDINVTIEGAINHQALLLAGRDINMEATVLNIAAARTDDDVILSNNDINIKVNTLTNYGEIAAYNDLNITVASEVNNNRLLLANNNLNIYGGNIYNNDGASIFASNNVGINTDGAITNQLGNVYGMNGITIKGLKNARSLALMNYGLIESRNGSVVLNANTISNLSIHTCDPTAEICYRTDRRWDYDGDIYYDATYHNEFWGHIYDYLSYIPNAFEVASRGQILASKAININTENLINRSSVINAGEEINISTSGLYNIRASEEVLEEIKRYDVSFSYPYDYYLPNELLMLLQYKLDSCRRGGCTTRSMETRPVSLFSATPAVISAPRVNINAQNTVYNDYYTEETANIAWSITPSNPTTQQLGESGISLNLTDLGYSGTFPINLADSIQNGFFSLSPVDSVPNGLFFINTVDLTYNGLFKPAKPDSQYLFVGTSRFINPNSYIGFDYFYGLTGVEHDTHITKVLGDPFYEQKMIEETILRLTGSRYIYDDIADMNTQMTRLYDNAFIAYNEHNLVIGQPLTAEQIRALPDNIIWYVAQEINGQKVLVPTLYVAEHNKEQFLNNLNNSTIRGEQVNITADDIMNSGNIEGGVAHLYASGDIKNLSGVIYAQDSLDITAGGSITNETKKNTIQYSGKSSGSLFNKGNNYNYQHEYLSDVGSISSGGDLSMMAGQDINIKAAEVVAGNNLNMQAKNVNIGTVELNQDLRSYGSNYKHENSSTTNVGSLIEAGNDININATNDITIKASDVLAQNDINLEAENVNILSATDSSHYYSYYKTKSGFMGSKTNIEEDRLDKSWQVGSNVGALGNLNINANKDITVLASNLSTENGNMLLDAANNINILAGLNEEKSLHRKESSNWWGLTGSGDTTYDEIRTLEAASAFSGDNIIFKSGKDTTIFASDVGANNDGNIQTGGNFNLLAGIESNYHEEQHWEKSFSDVVAGFDGGRLYAGIEYKITEDTLAQYDEQARASTLSFGGNLNVDAEKNINIAGSEIAADTATFTAENINVTAQEEKHTTDAMHKEGTITATVGIGNAYVDAGYAVDAFVKAGENVKAAKDKLSEMEKKYEEGKASKQAVEDAKIGLAMATATLVQAELNMSQSMAAAGGGSILGGMYANLQVEGRYTEMTANNEAVTNLGSSILTNGNVNFNAGNDMLQQGSAAGSLNGDVNYNIGGDLNLIASQDRFNFESKTESYMVSASAGTNGGGLSGGYDASRSAASGITNNNSISVAQNGAINYNIGGDMTGAGYNAFAQDINANVAGALTLESLQDTYYSNNSGYGFSGGIGFGNDQGGTNPFTKYMNAVEGLSSVSGGYNQSSGYIDVGWVNNQTSLTGTNSVNIEADKINLKGAGIANITEGGTDGGNLTVKTNELTWEDVKDYDYSEQNGFGINLTIAKGHRKGDKYEGEMQQAYEAGLEQGMSGADAIQYAYDNVKQTLTAGGASVDYKHEGAEKEQTTRATLGEGNIIIGGEEQEENSELLASLNRDIGLSQEVIRDEITGAVDAHAEIDLRWFTTEGIANIAADHKEAIEAVKKAAEQGIEISKQVIEVFDKMSSKEIGEGLGYLAVGGKGASNKEKLDNFKDKTGRDFTDLSKEEKETYYKEEGDKLKDIKRQLDLGGLQPHDYNALVRQALEIQRAIPVDLAFGNMVSDIMSTVFSICKEDPVIKYAAANWDSFSDIKKRNILQYALEMQLDAFDIHDGTKVVVDPYLNSTTRGLYSNNIVYINSDYKLPGIEALSGIERFSERLFDNYQESMSTLWHEGIHKVQDVNKDNPAYAMYNNYIPYFPIQNVGYRASENILYYNNTEEYLPQYFGNKQSELDNLQKLPSFSFTGGSNVSMFLKTLDWGRNGTSLYKK